MSPVDELRAAGFSETEIGSWVDERRKVLKEGGFADNEADAYFTGGPVVKETIPQAWLRRMQAAEKFNQNDEALANFGAAMATRPIEEHKRSERIVQAVTAGGNEGVGSEPYGLTLADDKWLRDKGVFGDGAIRYMNEAVARPTAAAIEALFRGVAAASSVAGAFTEQLAKEGAQDQNAATGLGRDVKGILDMAGVAQMLHPSSPGFTRATRRPGGEVVDEPIGGLPKSGDFRVAAESIVHDAPEATVQAVQGKLNSLWERGYHPAEVLEDIKTDPTVKADLLSKTPMLPEKYRTSTDFTKQDDLFGKQPEQGSFRFMNEAEQKPPVEANPKYVAGENGLYRTDKDELRSVNSEPISRQDMEWGLNKGRKNEQPIYKRMIDDNTSDRVQTELALEDNYQPSFRFDSGEIKAPEAVDLEGPALSDKPGTGTGSGGSGDGGSGKPVDLKGEPSFVRRAADKASQILHTLYTDFVDNIHPIAQLDRDAYQAARLFRGRFGVVKQFLENNTVDFNTLKPRGKGLNNIIKGIKDHAGLNEYLTAQVEMRSGGPNAAAAVETLKKGKAQFGQAAKEIDQFRNEVLEYLHDSGVLNKETLESLKLLDETYSALAPVLKGEALPVDPLANIIRNTYHYIGLAQKNLVNQKIFSALQEAGLGVEGKPSLNAQMGKNMREYAKMNDLKAPPAAVTNILKQILPDDGANISAIFDGKRRSLRIDDKELLGAIRNLSPQNVDKWIQLAAKPASWLRAGVTLDPSFQAKNLIRDSLTAFITAGSTPLSTLKGAGHALSGTRAAKALGFEPTETFQSWLSSGGANATFVHLDQAYLSQSLRHLESQTGLTTRAWNVIKSPLDGLRVASELIENSVRLGAFQKAMKGAKSVEDIKDAAFASREVTLDFAKIGAKVQAMNLMTAFFNVPIQGLDRIARAFRDAPAATTMKVGGAVTLPSLYLWWANKDDERYKALPQWQKDMFWIIPTDSWKPISADDAQGKPPYMLRKTDKGTEFNDGTIWRLPKGELGIMFGTSAERLAEKYYAKNPDAMDHLNDTAQNLFIQSFIPTAAAPFIEQGMNLSQMTERNVIPGYLEKELPEYQYTPYTTELSKFLGHAMASLPGVREQSLDKNSLMIGGAARGLTSPILIENYMRAWTGGVGRLMLEGADWVGKKTGALPDVEGPTTGLAENPFIRAFVIRHPSANTQAIQDFYEEYDRNERYLKSFMSQARGGNVEAAEKIQALGGDQIFVKLDGIRKVLSDHGSMIRSIYKNPEIKPAEQRQLIDTLYTNMSAIGKEGRETLRSLRTQLAPAPQAAPAPTQTPKSVNPGIPLEAP